MIGGFEAWQARIEQELTRHLQSHGDLDDTKAPAQLRAAMKHALLAGGKRLRPLLCFSVCDVVGGATDDAVAGAVALEWVHTYSLVHDDLPSLDDDDLRRGQPTVQKAFNEATAILAGDGLLTDAFAVLASTKHDAALQVRELALAAGSAGMVGGQNDDMQNEGASINGASTSETSLREVHRRKTGRLFGAAAALGALSANRKDLLDDARRYGHLLGFAFQVQDDVLDVEGDVEKGGKVRGRDVKHDKLTYVRARGLDGAKALAKEVADEAVAAAVVVGDRAGRDPALLVRLARFAVERNH